MATTTAHAAAGKQPLCRRRDSITPLLLDPRMMALLLLAVAVYCVGGPFGAVQPVLAADFSYFATHTNSCFASGLLPHNRHRLNFCAGLHPDAKCCSSLVDDGLLGWYKMATDGSTPECTGAAPRVHMVMKEIRDWLCIACDPREPSYRYLQRDGDVHLGGLAPPNADAGDEDYGWRVCSSFLYGADGKTGLWGGDGSKFSECGFQAQACKKVGFLSYNANDGNWTRVLQSDTCEFPNEVDPVFPAAHFTGKEGVPPAAEVLLNLPNEIDVFAFYIVNDSDPAYDYERAPCFGRSSAAAALQQATKLLMGAVLALWAVVVLCGQGGF